MAGSAQIHDERRGVAYVAGAVANAIYDAVGVRITDLPITPEKVLRALKPRTQRA